MVATAAPKRANKPAAKKGAKGPSGQGKKKPSVKRGGKPQTKQNNRNNNNNNTKGKQKKNTKNETVCGQVDEDYEVDGMERYTGECVYFNRTGGFGFIKLATEGVVPDDKVMVHWKEIQSDDRWPFLHKGLAVECNLEKVQKNGVWQVRAQKVSGLGGDQVSLQDEIDDQREFVGEKSLRFLGNIKFYDFDKGFGYVRLQDGYDIDDSVPEEFRIDRSEITTTDGQVPRLQGGMEIEFGIYKTKKGNYACYHVTMPGGDHITREAVEQRDNVTSTQHTGTMLFFDGRKGFGWIKPENQKSLPKNIKDAMAADLAKRQEKAKKRGKDEDIDSAIYVRLGDKAVPGQKLLKGAKVKFNLYTDSNGVGAANVEMCEE